MNHFDLRLTPQELDKIANLLSQQPWFQVNDLLVNIKAQIDYQQKAEMAVRSGNQSAHDEAVIVKPSRNTAFGPNGETEADFLAHRNAQ